MKMSDIWVTKYKPVDIKDITGNKAVVNQLIAIADAGNLPNLILAGPPGIGKTTACHCLVNRLLGTELAKKAVLELNASDDRGINVVRERIKEFAQLKISLPDNRHKIIILDEVDSMTEAAQQALRRIMEIYSGSTRFALACNVSTKIIEPIQSRCAILRFRRLQVDEITTRLKEICQLEKVEYNEAGLENLVFAADGDMRCAINNMQAAADGFGVVTDESVNRIADHPSKEKISQMITHCLNGRYEEAQTALKDITSEGFAPLEVLQNVLRTLKVMDMKEMVKLAYFEDLARVHQRMVLGADTVHQLEGLVASFYKSAMTAC